MNFDMLPDFPAPSAFQTGRMTFDLPSTRLETSFLRGPEASRTLVVWFRGAVDRSASAPAYEVPLNPAYAGWAHQIALRDPTLDLNPDLRLGWYIGGPDHDLQIELRRFFATLRATLGLDRIIYIGSSGGGFASLFFSRHDDKSCAIAIEPQVSIPNYFYFTQFARLVWSGSSAEEIGQQRILDLSREYRTSFHNTVIYVQNTTDKEHIRSHMLPLLTACFAENASNIICNTDFWGGAGHGLMPVSITSLWLKSAITAPSLSAGDILQTCHKLRQEKLPPAPASASAARPAKEADPEQIALADRVRAFQLGL